MMKISIQSTHHRKSNRKSSLLSSFWIRYTHYIHSSKQCTRVKSQLLLNSYRLQNLFIISFGRTKSKTAFSNISVQRTSGAWGWSYRTLRSQQSGRKKKEISNFHHNIRYHNWSEQKHPPRSGGLRFCCVGGHREFQGGAEDFNRAQNLLI